MTSFVNDSIITEFESHFLHRNDKLNRWGNSIPSIQMFTGLRGLYPMASALGGGSAGDAVDLSGNGLPLTYNGNPTYNYDEFVPYISFDGTGDFLDHTDTGANDPFDILGTETYIASAVRGLTFGGWFRTADVTPAANNALIGKWLAAGNQQSYEIRLLTTGVLRGLVSIDGAATTTIDSTETISNDVWFNVALRLDPGNTDLSIFVNGEEDVNAAAPASIFGSSADFAIGGSSGGLNLLTGDASKCWVCAAALHARQIRGAFEQAKKLYNL